MFKNYTPPEAKILNLAKIQAFTAPIVDIPPAGFRGGVVLGNTQSEQKLRHSRYGKPVDSFSEDIEKYHSLSGNYIYFGPLYNHFGHTMAEFIHRIIPSLLLSPWRQFIMISAKKEDHTNFNNVPAFILDILSFLKIDRREVSILSDDFEVEKLFVCEQGSDFGAGPKNGYLRFLDQYTPSRLDEIFETTIPSLRTYVSRTGISHGGSFLGERYIESFLRDSGYYIMHPEQIPLAKQMHIYRSSRVLVFPEGAACHGIEFFGNHALTECHLLERRVSHREIYRRVFHGRARNYSSLSGAVDLGSAVLDRITGQKLDNFGVYFLPKNLICQYLEDVGIASTRNFSHISYVDAAFADFERYLSYHREIKSRMLCDEELKSMRRHVNEIILR
jgi:hypothetical protein